MPPKHTGRPVLACFPLAFAIPWVGIILICLPRGIPGTGAALAELQPAVLAFMLLARPSRPWP